MSELSDDNSTNGKYKVITLEEARVDLEAFIAECEHDNTYAGRFIYNNAVAALETPEALQSHVDRYNAILRQQSELNVGF